MAGRSSLPSLARSPSPSSSSEGEPSRGAVVGNPRTSPTTPPLELFQMMRKLNTSSSSSSSTSSSSSFGPPGRRSESDASSEMTASAEGNWIWLALLRAKLEHTDELAAFLKGISNRVLANEPDVLSHRILRGVDDEDELLGTKFVVYSEFRDDDAFDAHIQGDEFQLLVNNARLLEGPPQFFSYRDIPLPDPEGSFVSGSDY